MFISEEKYWQAFSKQNIKIINSQSQKFLRKRNPLKIPDDEYQMTSLFMAIMYDIDITPFISEIDMLTIDQCKIKLTATDVEYSDVDEDLKTEVTIYKNTNALMFAIQIGKINVTNKIIQYLNSHQNLSLINILSQLNSQNYGILKYMTESKSWTMQSLLFTIKMNLVYYEIQEFTDDNPIKKAFLTNQPLVAIYGLVLSIDKRIRNKFYELFSQNYALIYQNLFDNYKNNQNENEKMTEEEFLLLSKVLLDYANSTILDMDLKPFQDKDWFNDSDDPAEEILNIYRKCNKYQIYNQKFDKQIKEQERQQKQNQPQYNKQK